MKIVKCGKIDENDYCIVMQKYKNSYTNQIFSTYDLFVDITKDDDLQQFFKLHKNDEHYRCAGLSKGVVSVGMNGKPKTKFRDHMFIKFPLQTRDQREVLDEVEKNIKRFCEFKIMATLEGVCLYSENNE